MQKTRQMVFNGVIGRRLLNVREAAQYLGLDEDTIYRKARLRELPSVKFGRALRFDLRALELLIERHAIESIDWERSYLKVSIKRKADGLFEVRWWEGGRNKSVRVHGSFELAKKIERKKMSTRDENRHLEVRREINLRMSMLIIDRYWNEYGLEEKIQCARKSIVEGIRKEMCWQIVRAGGRWRRGGEVVCEPHGRQEAFGGDSREAFSRHAPHDGEGLDDLVQGNRDRPESGRSSRSEASR